MVWNSSGYKMGIPNLSGKDTAVWIILYQARNIGFTRILMITSVCPNMMSANAPHCYLTWYEHDFIIHSFVYALIFADVDPWCCSRSRVCLKLKREHSKPALFHGDGFNDYNEDCIATDVGTHSLWAHHTSNVFPSWLTLHCHETETMHLEPMSTQTYLQTKNRRSCFVGCFDYACSILVGRTGS